MTRIARCRMLNRHDNRCTAEAVDQYGEILICARHLALCLELLNSRRLYVGATR